MVQYLRQALKNDIKVTQKLDMLLGASPTVPVLRNEKNIETETKEGKYNKNMHYIAIFIFSLRLLGKVYL